jgi:hypothetical protein
VHAAVLAHQPGEAAVHVALVEADQVPELGVQAGERLVGADVLGRDRREVVPLRQATSQALQPMQVVVSMYLATLGVLRMPLASPSIAAEERRISSPFAFMPAPHLLDAHRGRSCTRCPHVGLEHGGGQEVRQRPTRTPA